MNLSAKRLVAGLLVLTVFTVFGGALSACGNSNEIDEETRAIEAEIYPLMPVRFDPALTKNERKLVVRDFRDLLAQGVVDDRQNNVVAAAFNAAFGTSPQRTFLPYLKERINYVIPSLADHERRMKVNLLGGENLLDTDRKAFILAVNWGAWLWYEHVVRDRPVSYEFDGTQIPVTSTRVGIVQLGTGYVRKEIGSHLRAATLIHEARHSDCTGGLSNSDLSLMRDNPDQWPEEKSCGHLHALCPSDHDLKGYAACDQHPWGAYAIEVLYLSGVLRNCAGCAEEERQALKITLFDAVSRVLLMEEMLRTDASGKPTHGMPDMSSAGLRQN